MKKRILSLFLTLIMAMTLMPVSALAAEPDATPAVIYVSSSGYDATGNGTEDSPYATLAKAVDIAPDGATIYVMSDLTSTKCARYYSKSLTIKSDEDAIYTITRGDNFETIADSARSWYNPAMIEVCGTPGKQDASLRLENIVLDDAGKKAGTNFNQATTDGSGGNTALVQDAIIATYNNTATITLGDGAVLKNFGGMSAVRIADGILVMESGSKICDDIMTVRTKESGDYGPAGAIWMQGGDFTMENGAEISNVNGRAVYADSGTVTIGGTISGIKSNSKMWQGTSGIAIHLRNNASGKLTSTALIEEISGGGSTVYTNGCDLTAENGSSIKDLLQTIGVTVTGECEVYFDGEITGMTGASNALNLQNAAFHVTLGKNAYIHDNHVGYGTVYIQAQNGILDIYGKINNNIASDRGGAIAMGNNFKYPTIVTMYDGAEICNNYSAQTGGGVMVSVGIFTMKGGTISNNLAKQMGGGVYVRRGGNFIMEGGTIENNTTAQYGGGIAYEAGNYNNGIPCVTLNGGTITGNTMSATIEKDSKTENMVASGGVSNDISVLNKDNVFSHINRYLFLSDDVTIGDRAVYFEKDTKTVTLASDSLDIKLGNASTEAVNALKTASATKGWGAPLATFWAQRTGAATLTVGGLSLNNSLPVYVLTIPVGEDGNPAEGAAANCYAAAVTTDGVKFTVPAANLAGNGCAIAIVQPTDDYGTLTISGPETIKQNKANADYPVTYTVTYTMSKNLKGIIAQTEGDATYDLAVNADTRLSGTPGSFDGNCIQVTYTLPNSAFNVGDILYASAELTIAIGVETYKVPSNVAETRLTGLGSFNVMFDWNDGSGKTETISVVEGEALGDKMPANPTRSGYTFTGWNTQADGRGTAFTSATVVNSDLTVYAQWQKNSSDSDNSGSSGTPSGLNTKDHYSYIIGYQDGTLQPYGTITRGEVATIFFRLLTEETREANWSTTNNYADCSPDLWCNNAISTLTRMGIIEGFEDGTFRPNARITRAQFAKIAVGFFETTKEDYAGFFTDVNIGAWYTEYVEAAAHVGLIEGFGDGTFRPDTNITRAQACVIVNRALGRKPDEEHLLNDDEMLTWPDNNPDDWFYADMQEATNSHDYSWITVNDKDGGRVKIENWTEKLPQRDWIAFEHAWSTAYSAPGGEVTQ